MRRRQQLRVDTFPFLAVLLCAMGSLILVLLVMDRRSRLVAQARATQQISSRIQEHTAKVSARQRENDRRRQNVQATWQKKRDELQKRVDQQEQQLDRNALEVQARLAEAARRLRQEEEVVTKLRQQVQAEQTRLADEQKELRSAQEKAGDLAKQLREAERLRSQLAADLVTLEKTLAELREIRKQQADTYSVVPYRGKHGDDRKPVYVECTETGFLFHPDKKAVAEEAALRDELTRRFTAQKEDRARAGLPAARAYVLVLVRPEGIRHYYQLQSLVRQLKADLGYEFIDSDWKLQFPDDPVQPSTLAKHSAPPPLDPPSTTGAETGNKGGSTRPRLGIEEQTGSTGSADDRKPAATMGLPRSMGNVVGLSRPTPLGSLEGAAGSSAVRPPSASGSLLEPSLPELPGGNSTNRAGVGKPPELSSPSPSLPAGPVMLPTTERGAEGAEPTHKESSSRLGEQSARPGNGQQKPVGPQLDSPVAETREPILRPALVSGAGVLTVFIECRADQVIVHPTAQAVPLEGLHLVPAINPLYQTVHQLITRRQATLASRDTPFRVQIRFLVHRDAERVYHQAYPALQTIPVPKKSYLLQPGDSVEQILNSD